MCYCFRSFGLLIGNYAQRRWNKYEYTACLFEQCPHDKEGQIYLVYSKLPVGRVKDFKSPPPPPLQYSAAQRQQNHSNSRKCRATFENLKFWNACTVHVQCKFYCRILSLHVPTFHFQKQTCTPHSFPLCSCFFRFLKKKEMKMTQRRKKTFCWQQHNQ